MHCCFKDQSNCSRQGHNNFCLLSLQSFYLPFLCSRNLIHFLLVLPSVALIKKRQPGLDSFIFYTLSTPRPKRFLILSQSIERWIILTLLYSRHLQVLWNIVFQNDPIQLCKSVLQDSSLILLSAMTVRKRCWHTLILQIYWTSTLAVFLRTF